MANEDNKGDKILSGLTALVTSAGSRIGGHIALALANAGARVALADSDAASAQAYAQEISVQGRTCTSFQLDVTSEDDWRKTIDAVLSRWGKLDILVHIAGTTYAGPLFEMSGQEWRRVLAANLDSVFFGTKHAIRAMRVTGGGSIINIFSAAGEQPASDSAAVFTSKAAITMLSKMAALECTARWDRIRVNTISPGPADRATKDDAHFGEKMPVQLTQPLELTELILYLSSPDSLHITGVNYLVENSFYV
jgi:3(or 17)beta-hydroxysteroid dehydrogenase